MTEMFPPRPGGMVDSARQQQGQAVEAPPEVVTAPTPYEAVRVRTEAPDIGTAVTVPLSSANPVMRLLPQDMMRRSAVVLAIANDVYISSDHGAARNAAAGQPDSTIGYLPAGIAVPIDSQTEFWAAVTTTDTPSPVLVIIGKDSA